MSAAQTVSKKTLNTEVYTRTIALDLQQKANLQLLNNIASSATGTAAATSAIRHKISLDLHDSTIQPYIGLKLGLEALRRKIPEGAALAAEVDELVNMAEESIAELRQYVAGLKSQISPQLKVQLGISPLDAILELAKKYKVRHGIEVLVNVDRHLKLNEQLSAEIYQLVCEGLSNIHRHTQSKKAEISLYNVNNQLVLQVINQDESAQGFIHFKPRSMAERVSYLGGHVSVYHTTANKALDSKTLMGRTLMSRTLVTAKIPLQSMERISGSLA